MKYPRNKKEAEKALEAYQLNLSEHLPKITVNLVNDIKEDYVEVNLMDAMLIDGTPCESPLVVVQSMQFDLCDQSQKELEINTSYMEVRNFLAAADAISQYIYSRRELEEIL